MEKKFGPKPGEMSFCGKRRKCPWSQDFKKKGIKVDPTKVELIAKLPPPTNVNGIKSFLGHVGFYKRFIKDTTKQLIDQGKQICFR